jgi:hypothetical protein
LLTSRSAVRQLRPQLPCRLVGDSHRSFVHTAAFLYSPDPLTQGIVVAVGHADQGARPVDKQGAQVLVTTFTDAKQNRSTAGRPLAWNEPESSQFRFVALIRSSIRLPQR